MIPKPRSFAAHYASHFKDAGIIEAYHHRPPYTAELFEILSDLIVDTPRVVLDAGCGPGDIARGLVDYVERVDAVDFSKGMIEKGRDLPGGTRPVVNWILGRMEDVALSPPYSLVTAGDSLGWME